MSRFLGSHVTGENLHKPIESISLAVSPVSEAFFSLIWTSNFQLPMPLSLLLPISLIQDALQSLSEN
jgi:hypothetical protein